MGPRNRFSNKKSRRDREGYATVTVARGPGGGYRKVLCDAKHSAMRARYVGLRNELLNDELAATDERVELIDTHLDAIMAAL